MTDTLPAGLTYVSDDGGAQTSEAAGVITWTPPDLASAGSDVLQITATVTGTAAMTNTAEVTAVDQNDPDSTPNDGAGDDYATALVIPQSADLSVTKVVDIASPISPLDLARVPVPVLL